MRGGGALLALAAALAAAAPAAARADEPKLPFAPFEGAKKGDWAVLVGSSRRDENTSKEPCASYARVVAVEGDLVTVEELVEAGGIDKAKKTFSAKEAPTVAAYFDLKEGTIQGFAVADDERTVCGVALACKKLSFVWKHGDAADEITAWLSPRIKAGALAAFKLRSKGRGKVELDTQVRLECGGTGTEAKRALGEAPEELLSAKLLEALEGGAELPAQPFARAKKGAWAAYRLELEQQGETSREILELEVASATSDSVVIAPFRVGHQGEGQKRAFELDAPPNVVEYASLFATSIALPEKGAINGARSAPEKLTVGDRDFDCTKLTFTLRTLDERFKVKLWLSSEIEGTGLVAAEVRRFGERAATLTLEVGGFGDEDRTVWGKPAERLARKKNRKKSEDE